MTLGKNSGSSPKLDTQCPHLRSCKKACCLGPTPTDSDVISLVWGLGFRIFKECISDSNVQP